MVVTSWVQWEIFSHLNLGTFYHFRCPVYLRHFSGTSRTLMRPFLSEWQQQESKKALRHIICFWSNSLWQMNPILCFRFFCCCPQPWGVAGIVKMTSKVLLLWRSSWLHFFPSSCSVIQSMLFFPLHWKNQGVSCNAKQHPAQWLYQVFVSAWGDEGCSQGLNQDRWTYRKSEIWESHSP